ncbi:MAG: CDP-alcohol phosphatidyltransferase family protein [Cyclobacteriaceae bacterium]
MISVYQLKSGFQRLLRPVLAGMRKMGISPNQITIAAILLSFILGILLWNVKDLNIALLLVPIGLLLRMALNALDGMMATTYHLQSKKGEVLNEMGDIISDLFIYIPIIQFQDVSPVLLTVFIALAVTNEFAGILAKVISGSRRYDGPMGKSDRAFVVGLTLLLAWFFPQAISYFNYLLGGCVLLMLVSTFVRINKGLQGAN